MNQLQTLFKLGRVSNLPTIWSNILAGLALSHYGSAGASLMMLFVAMSLFYTGGMFLNDAFDADFDASSRSDRPIPNGDITRQTVFLTGFIQLIFGFLLIVYYSYLLDAGIKPVVFSLVLCSAIVLYNWHHKNNPLSPLIMGVCRCMVYLCSYALFTSALSPMVAWATLTLLCYLIGLTFTAKQENLNSLSSVWPLAFLFMPVLTGLILLFDGSSASAIPLLLLTLVITFALWLLRRRAAGDIPTAVQQLIAGISLLDALWITATGEYLLAFIAALGYPLTLYLQRYYRGT